MWWGKIYLLNGSEKVGNDLKGDQRKIDCMRKSESSVPVDHAIGGSIIYFI